MNGNASGGLLGRDSYQIVVDLQTAQFRQEMKRAQQQLTDFQRQTGASMAGVRQAGAQAAQGFGQSWSTVARETTTGLSVLTKNLHYVRYAAYAAAGVGGILGIATSMRAVAMEGWRFNMQMEQSKIGFETMLGSAEKANEYLKRLWDFAAKTPFEFPQLVQATQRLLAFGFQAEKVIPMLKNIGDAVSGLGRGPYEIERVIYALGQMQAKAKVSAEEMMQLTEVGIPGWEMMADALGVTTAEAMRLAQKGLIPVEEAIDALIKGMGDRFPNMMDKQSASLQGMISTLKDAITQIGGTLTEDAYNFVKETLGIILPAVQEFGTLVGEEGIIGALVKKIPDAEIALRALVDVWQALVTVAEAGLPFVQGMVIGFMELANPVISGALRVLGDTLASMAFVLDRIPDLWIQILGGIAGAASAIATFVKVSALMAGLVPLFGRVTTAAKALATANTALAASQTAVATTGAAASKGGFLAALSKLGPAGLASSAAIAALAGGVYYLAKQSEDAANKVDTLSTAVKELRAIDMDTSPEEFATKWKDTIDFLNTLTRQQYRRQLYKIALQMQIEKVPPQEIEAEMSRIQKAVDQEPVQLNLFDPKQQLNAFRGGINDFIGGLQEQIQEAEQTIGTGTPVPFPWMEPEWINDVGRRFGEMTAALDAGQVEVFAAGLKEADAAIQSLNISTESQTLLFREYLRGLLEGTEYDMSERWLSAEEALQGMAEQTTHAEQKEKLLNAAQLTTKENLRELTRWYEYLIKDQKELGEGTEEEIQVLSESAEKWKSATERVANMRKALNEVIDTQELYALATETSEEKTKRLREEADKVPLTLDRIIQALDTMRANREEYEKNLQWVSGYLGGIYADWVVAQGDAAPEYAKALTQGTEAELNAFRERVVRDVFAPLVDLAKEKGDAVADKFVKALAAGGERIAKVAAAYIGILSAGLEPVFIEWGGKEVVTSSRVRDRKLMRWDEAEGGLRLPGQAIIQHAQEGLVQWAEPETGGEAFIPLSPTKRQRSRQIWWQTGHLLGMYADGGFRRKEDIPSPPYFQVNPALADSSAQQASNIAMKTSYEGALEAFMALYPALMSGPAFGGMAQSTANVWHSLVNHFGGLTFWGGYATSGHVKNSDHYTGHAFDVHASGGVMEAIYQLLRRVMFDWGIKYVIHNSRITTRSGERVYRGTNPHDQHVHVSTYDDGGFLNPGWTLAYNGTGRPERVFADGGFTKWRKENPDAPSSDYWGGLFPSGVSQESYITRETARISMFQSADPTEGAQLAMMLKAMSDLVDLLNRAAAEKAAQLQAAREAGADPETINALATEFYGLQQQAWEASEALKETQEALDTRAAEEARQAYEALASSMGMVKTSTMALFDALGRFPDGLVRQLEMLPTVMGVLNSELSVTMDRLREATDPAEIISLGQQAISQISEMYQTETAVIERAYRERLDDIDEAERATLDAIATERDARLKTIDDERDALDKAHQEEMDRFAERREAIREQYDSAIEGTRNYYDAQIEALRGVETQRTREEQRARMRESIAGTKRDIASITAQGYYTEGDIERLIDLREQVAEQEEEARRQEEDWARGDRIDQLEAERDAILEGLQTRREAAEEALSLEQESAQERYDAATEALGKERQQVLDHYEDVEKDAKDHYDRERKAAKENYDAAMLEANTRYTAMLSQLDTFLQNALGKKDSFHDTGYQIGVALGEGIAAGATVQLGELGSFTWVPYGGTTPGTGGTTPGTGEGAGGTGGTGGGTGGTGSVTRSDEYFVVGPGGEEKSFTSRAAMDNFLRGNPGWTYDDHIITYTTSDGRRFTDKAAAEAHQAELNGLSFAAGGIVPGHGPQLALVHGGEAVVPERVWRQWYFGAATPAMTPMTPEQQAAAWMAHQPQASATRQSRGLGRWRSVKNASGRGFHWVWEPAGADGWIAPGPYAGLPHSWSGTPHEGAQFFNRGILWTYRGGKWKGRRVGGSDLSGRRSGPDSSATTRPDFATAEFSFLDPPSWAKLARGGLITKPTVALLGESGPEAVIPLDKAGGSYKAISIHISSDGRADIDKAIPTIVRTVKDELAQEYRRDAFAWGRR